VSRPDAAGRGRLAVLLAAVVVQLAVLYWPRPPDVGAGVPGLDLVVHLAVFGAVAWAGRRAGLPVVPLVAALVLHAAVSEVVQAYLVPDRTGDWRDAVADVVGTVGGVLVASRGRSVAGGRTRATS
jgi:hypothetical protein